MYQLIERYYPEFERTYDERYERRYGRWRPVVAKVCRRFVRCIERRQHELIERVLRRRGLWEGPIRTLASARPPPRCPRRAAAAASNLELVPDPEFLEFQRLESQPPQSCELQLVLDPEYL